MKKLLMMIGAMAVVCGAMLPMAARAETHTLQPYAFVQSHSVNIVDTGYHAKSQSRYYIDYQLVNSSVQGQGIFGDTAGTIKCALYIPANTTTRTYWYYRSSGSDSVYWGLRDNERRNITIKNPTDSSCSATMRRYDGVVVSTKDTTWVHKGTSETTTINLFALTSAGSYIAGEKRIFCFEAADSSTATTPNVFLAPTTNALGAAGFYDVIGGEFHGEANTGVASDKVLTFSNGIGSADDYKYEGGVFSAKFHAYASDTEKGSVAFGSAAASGTAEAWVARGSSVTLRATPAEDCDFVSWSGDTRAITSGDTESPTITVKSDTAVQLLATFKGKTVYTWTGAADESEPQWFTLANWIDGDGNVPSQLDGYSHFAFPQSGDVTVNYNPSDASFRIKTLTFESGAGKVTVTGAAMARVESVVCENGQANELQNGVAFADKIDVTATSGNVNFAGGATGAGISNHTTFNGKYNITATGDWSPPDGSTLKTGSELNLLDGTYYDHINRMTVEAGGRVNVKNAKMVKSSPAYLLNPLNGTFAVTNELFVSGNGATSYKTHYACRGGNGTNILQKLRITSYACLVPAATTIVGAGGVFRDGEGYVRVPNDGSREFGAYADWTMYCDRIGSNTGTANFAFFKQSSNTTWSYLTFDTTDYYDSTIGRTITSEALIGAASGSAAKFGVTVKGIGRFVFANTNNSGAIFSGGLTVKDSATIVVKNNSHPGRGNVTLQDSSRLVVPSGKITLDGTLAFGAGTSLVVSNLTADATAPVTAAGATAEAGARIVVGGTTQLAPGKYPVLTLASAEAAAALVPNLTLDATAVRQKGDARLVAKDETVCVSIPSGFVVFVK